MPEPQLTGIRIQRPFDTEAEFIRNDGLAIGRLGMIVMGAPQRVPGITVRFEILLAGGEPVFRGEGRVVAYRVHGNGREGLEVRFTRLDSKSKAIVDQVLSLRRSGVLTSASESIQAPPSIAPGPNSEPGPTEVAFLPSVRPSLGPPPSQEGSIEIPALPPLSPSFLSPSSQTAHSLHSPYPSSPYPSSPNPASSQPLSPQSSAQYSQGQPSQEHLAPDQTEAALLPPVLLSPQPADMPVQSSVHSSVQLSAESSMPANQRVPAERAELPSGRTLAEQVAAGCDSDGQDSVDLPQNEQTEVAPPVVATWFGGDAVQTGDSSVDSCDDESHSVGEPAATDIMFSACVVSARRKVAAISVAQPAHVEMSDLAQLDALQIPGNEPPIDEDYTPLVPVAIIDGIDATTGGLSNRGASCQDRPLETGRVGDASANPVIMAICAEESLDPLSRTTLGFPQVTAIHRPPPSGRGTVGGALQRLRTRSGMYEGTVLAGDALARLRDRAGA